MVEVMKIMVTSLKRSPACTATLSAPDPAAGRHPPTPPPEPPGHPRARLGQSPVGSQPLSPGSWCTSFCLCPPRAYCPALRTFWRLCDGVNADLLQEGLRHTQVCCTQSPCPCGRPLLARTSRRCSNPLLSQSLWGPRVRCAPGWLEPSERLWWEWGLILNVSSPLLPTCWGFSFALGRGGSPHGWSSKAQPQLLTLDAGYLLCRLPLQRLAAAAHLSSAAQHNCTHLTR